MVDSGVVILFVISDCEETLLIICIPGDVFGLRPFFAKNNYMMTARAREESIIYAIPIATFRPFVAQNSEVLNFLLESFANNTSNPSDIENKGKLLSDNIAFSSKPTEIQYFQTLSYNRSPLKIAQNALIKDVAQLMTDNLVDNAIISELNIPVGIVTDTDMRIKVASGRVDINMPINKNASPTTPRANTGITSFSNLVAFSDVATAAYALRAESRSAASNLAYSKSSSFNFKTMSGLPTSAWVTPSTVASSIPSLDAIQLTAAPPAGPATAVASMGATPFNIPNSVSMN
jgi:hypothetical protein